MKTELNAMESNIRQECGAYCPRYEELLLELNKLENYLNSI